MAILFYIYIYFYLYLPYSSPNLALHNHMTLEHNYFLLIIYSLCKPAQAITCSVRYFLSSLKLFLSSLHQLNVPTDFPQSQYHTIPYFVLCFAALTQSVYN